MKCIKCGQELAENANFCMFCGSEVEKKCNNCGQELPVNALFCPICGTKVSTKIKTTNTVPVSVEEKYEYVKSILKEANIENIKVVKSGILFKFSIGTSEVGRFVPIHKDIDYKSYYERYINSPYDRIIDAIRFSGYKVFPSIHVYNFNKTVVVSEWHNNKFCVFGNDNELSIYDVNLNKEQYITKYSEEYRNPKTKLPEFFRYTNASGISENSEDNIEIVVDKDGRIMFWGVGQHISVFFNNKYGLMTYAEGGGEAVVNFETGKIYNEFQKYDVSCFLSINPEGHELISFWGDDHVTRWFDPATEQEVFKGYTREKLEKLKYKETDFW